MGNKPKILLLCGGPFAFPSLQKLAFEKYLGGLAIGSQDGSTASMLQQECERNQYPFLHISSGKEISRLHEWVKQLNADYIFSVCFPYKIPRETLELKPSSFFNFHTGLLPGFRGPMPIFEAIRRSEKETGIVTHLMDEGYDTGPVVFEEKIEINATDTFTQLAQKLSVRCGHAVLNMAEMLEFSTRLPKTTQDESIAAFYPFPTKEDRIIQWGTMEASEINALINACHGWSKGAITQLDGEEIMLSETTGTIGILNGNSKPGTILSRNELGLEIACKNSRTITVTVLAQENYQFGVEYAVAIGIEPGKLLH